MAIDPVPGRKRLGHAVLNASTEPADLAALARRRRLAHLIAVALLAIGIVASIFSPSDPQESNAATLVTGFSFILLGLTVVVSIQYTVRIQRMRKANARHPSLPEVHLQFTSESAAFRPIQQLRSAALLLESVLPEIEHIRPGITATADQTRLAIERTAQRLLLEEQLLATLTGGTHTDDARASTTRRNLADLTVQLRSGVDRYVNLTQQATVTATALGDLSGSYELQHAEDQLAGLNQGLQDIREISANES